MKENNGQMKALGAEYLRRGAICISGLAIYALGMALGVKAGSVGTNAWSTLSLGVANVCGITFGTANILTGIFFLVVDFLGKGKLGIGTFANWLLVSIFADVWLAAIKFIPEMTNPVLGVLFTLAGQTVISFSTILYMKSELGCGPRDTLMVIVGKLVPRIPIGAVKFTIELLALFIGWFLGAAVGIGTLLILLLQAGIFQAACRICRFEPRDIVHENLSDTARRIKEAMSGKKAEE